jgi:hypothetical protein
MPPQSPFLIRLAAADNILIIARSLAQGEAVIIDGQSFALPKALGLGHKLAARPIRAGEKIYKYGAPIGSATADIGQGEHVHLHNMKSDYMPTFTLDEGGQKYVPASH